MANINEKELLKIASLSKIAIEPREIPGIMKHMHDILNYAQRVKEVVQIKVEEPLVQNINTTREDIVIKTNSDPILEQAPEHKSHYFVFPAIIEKN